MTGSELAQLGSDHDVRLVAALSVTALISIETYLVGRWYRWAPRLRTTMTDASIFGVDLLLRGLAMPLRLAVFIGLGSLIPWELEASAVTLLLTYIGVDFIYYWKHRLFHATRLGWALHRTHHSSEELNFLATFRLNWIEAGLSYFFFIPLVLTGLPAPVLFILVEINDGWQFLCHTRLVNRLPWLDRVVNTPNIHRVHHARDPRLADRNFGSTLMIWDRLFGTYHPGLEYVECGLEQGSPRTIMAIQFGGLRELFSAPRSRSE